MQEWNKEPRPERAATSRKHEGIQQYLQEDLRTGDREVSSRKFQQVVESKGLDIMEGSAPSKAEKETEHRIKIGKYGSTCHSR
jgi:hypothetical protein